MISATLAFKAGVLARINNQCQQLLEAASANQVQNGGDDTHVQDIIFTLGLSDDQCVDIMQLPYYNDVHAFETTAKENGYLWNLKSHCFQNNEGHRLDNSKVCKRIKTKNKGGD